MPRRDDIQKILLIGSGPIVIGQACEFDYSGTQACKALREEGYEVVLVNSNPATIMTDPDTADRTYIEPLTWEMVAKVIEEERPDALLPTLGGQTGLNVAMDLSKHGVLEKFNVEMIGARADVIAKAEERDQFKEAMEKIGIEVLQRPNGAHHRRGPHGPGRSRPALRGCGPASRSAAAARPSPTTATSSIRSSVRGLDQSPVTEVLIEESALGWKEYEMEVMRDLDDNVVIICAIENFDAMGVHTGDSITVAPAQTLTDKEYQRMRDASLAVIREIGVETGGSNIQFAVEPQHRPHGRHRNEPPREPFQRPGQQGDRLPHRENRRQARRGLSPARAAQRYYPRNHGLLSSRPSITSSPKFRGSPLKNSPRPMTIRSPRK